MTTKLTGNERVVVYGNPTKTTTTVQEIANLASNGGGGGFNVQNYNPSEHQSVIAENNYILRDLSGQGNWIPSTGVVDFSDLYCFEFISSSSFVCSPSPGQ